MLLTDARRILADLLDGLGTLLMHPTDSIDRYSLALWQAYSMVSTLMQ